jgi:hypothetical protein
LVTSAHGEAPTDNGVLERFFGTLNYQHLDRATIGDGNASPM